MDGRRREDTVITWQLVCFSCRWKRKGERMAGWLLLSCLRGDPASEERRRRTRGERRDERSAEGVPSLRLQQQPQPYDAFSRHPVTRRHRVSSLPSSLSLFTVIIDIISMLFCTHLPFARLTVSRASNLLSLAHLLPLLSCLLASKFLRTSVRETPQQRTRRSDPSCSLFRSPSLVMKERSGSQVSVSVRIVRPTN